MGRPRTNLDKLATFHEREDVTVNDFLKDLNNDDLGELYSKLENLEHAVLNAKDV